MKLLRGIVLMLVALILTTGMVFAARDTVNIALKAEPSVLNPITYQDTESSFIMSAISDPLIEVTANGEFTTEGSILDSYSISED